MITDLPAMASSSYGTSNSTWDLGTAANGLFQITPTALTPAAPAQLGLQRQANAFAGVAQGGVYQPPKPKEKPAMVTRRLVQVFIADPDENVPLNQSLLYSGQQKLTDATDQELFFEIDIKAILDNYNDERVKLVNKKVKERVEYLEPVKIRDLKMVVVNVATF